MYLSLKFQKMESAYCCPAEVCDDIDFETEGELVAHWGELHCRPKLSYLCPFQKCNCEASSKKLVLLHARSSRHRNAWRDVETTDQQLLRKDGIPSKLVPNPEYLSPGRATPPSGWREPSVDDAAMRKKIDSVNKYWRDRGFQTPGMTPARQSPPPWPGPSKMSIYNGPPYPPKNSKDRSRSPNRHPKKSNRSPGRRHQGQENRSPGRRHPRQENRSKDRRHQKHKYKRTSTSKVTPPTSIMPPPSIIPPPKPAKRSTNKAQSSPVIQPDSSIPIQSKSSPPLLNDSSSIDLTNELEGLLHQQREAKFKLHVQYWLEKAKEIDNQIEKFHWRKVQDLTE